MESRREQLQCFDFSQNYYTNVTYQSVKAADDGRKERPYRLFEEPGKSTVTITFGLSGAENVSKIVLFLNHCRTTADSIVDIAFNGSTVIPNIRARGDTFGKESFSIDSDLKPESNVLTIQLASSSSGAYWLSDATIYIEREVDKTGKFIKSLQINYLENENDVNTWK